MKTTLVLGLGNDLLCDDGVGLRVATELAIRFRSDAGIRVIQSTESGLALLDLVTGYHRLIVIDAVITGQAPPGSIHQFEIQELPIASSLPPHFLGLAEVLALGRSLHLPMPADVVIFGIEAEDIFSVRTELTSAVQASLPRIISRVVAACQQGLVRI